MENISTRQVVPYLHVDWLRTTLSNLFCRQIVLHPTFPLLWPFGENQNEQGKG